MSMEIGKSEGVTPVGSEIPRETWRDGLCDCCRHGCCHPFCCLVYWCPFVALGQLLNRMNLNCCAQPASSPEKAHKSFTYNVILTIALIIWGIIVYAVAISIAVKDANEENEEPNDGNGIGETEINRVQLPPVMDALANIISIATGIYMLYAACTLRRYLRRRYQIPSTTCPEALDDCCCAYWCLACTLCQMGRHTANYEVVPAQCCSPTGLPPDHPAIV